MTLAWGLTFPLIRAAVQSLDPLVFVAARFGLAAIAFIPLVLLVPLARASLRGAWPGALVVALIAWVSYLSQTIGLKTVSAGRAGFITGTSVVMVPLLSPLFGRGKPTKVDLGAALLALVGIYLMTAPAGGGVGQGDLLILACAFTYAVYIHALQRLLERGFHETAIAGLQVWGVALFSVLILPLADNAGARWSPATLGAIGFCALVATVGTFWLQARYQGRTTPERTALIFSMEPVFAAGFGYLMLGETMAPLGFVGAIIILVAVLGVELIQRPLGQDRDS